MDGSMILQTINAALRLSIPIAYVAIGAVIIEKSGINAIAMEGMMLAGAFGAVIGSWLTGSPWVGVLMGILFGIAIGLIRGFFCINLRANQTVSGLGLNLLIVGAVHSGVAYCLYFSALKGLRGQETAILSYIDPLTAVAVSFAVLGEPVTPAQLLGGAMVLAFALANELLPVIRR